MCQLDARRILREGAPEVFVPEPAKDPNHKTRSNKNVPKRESLGKNKNLGSKSILILKIIQIWNTASLYHNTVHEKADRRRRRSIRRV